MQKERQPDKTLNITSTCIQVQIAIVSKWKYSRISSLSCWEIMWQVTHISCGFIQISRQIKWKISLAVILGNLIRLHWDKSIFTCQGSQVADSETLSIKNICWGETFRWTVQKEMLKKEDLTGGSVLLWSAGAEVALELALSGPNDSGCRLGPSLKGH